VITAPVAGRHRTYGALIQPPPVDAEKHLYLSRSLPYLAIGLTIAFLTAFASQVLFEYNSGYWAFGVFTLVGTSAFLMSTPLAFVGPGFDIGGHERLVRTWNPEQYPDVDIYLPICGEPIEILGNSWAAVAELVRAYPGWAFPYVLDDGADPAARAIAMDLGFGYVIRPNRGEYKKSGNLRQAFANTWSEFFVVFDADFAPRPDFLAETLPHFQDPDVAIVQTPQFFRTDRRQTWVESAAGAIHELVYRAIQVGRDRLGAYLPVVLATGMCPTGLNAFFRQQYAAGVQAVEHHAAELRADRRVHVRDHDRAAALAPGEL
jgi:cellulose synthase (UDP-forming)